MPKIYEYMGIVIFFYSNEHEPIHVHARKENYESKAEIVVIDGVIQQIVITDVKGKRPLKGKDLKNLKKMLGLFADSIVEKWIDYFVYNREVPFVRITTKL